MSWLVTTDLHLSDRARDGYRFGLFPWLVKQQKKHKTEATFILGDLTESKDRHSAALVNRIVEELLTLAPPVYILRGNHDGIDPSSPFFKFLSSISGLNFIVKPTVLYNYKIGMVPHCRTQVELDEGCKQVPLHSAAVFLHQTFNGAIAETGAPLNGLDLSPVRALKPWLGAYSGDVHVPQRQDGLIYVGAPYHIRFGDRFEPRCLLINGDNKRDLKFDCLRKHSLTVHDADEITNNASLRQGDQIKLTVELHREELVEWPEHRKRILSVCKEAGLEVFGIDCLVKNGRRERTRLQDERQANLPQDVFEAFCKSERVASDIKQAGMELLSAS